MEFKKDKLAIIFLIILLIIGTYLRFTDYDTIGYPHDSLLAIAGSVAWFYPMPYFPGLVYMGPPLGNMIIGAGCMLSGEDFSGVSYAHQIFSPDIPILIGQQMTNAEAYCKAPVYIFGLIFFLLLSILAILLFRSYYALFPIAFFTFSQFILEWSRDISVNIFYYVFVFAGLIFLWKAYISEKTSKKENIYFILTFVSFGLAGATKLSAGVYVLFSLIFILEKYWQEIKLLLKKILKIIKLKIAEKINIPEEVNLKPLIKKGAIYLIAYLLALLTPYKLSLKNMFDVINGFKKMEPAYVGIQINSNIFEIIHTFLMRINTLDLLIFIFSLFIFIKLIFKKQKQKNEKFILYFVFLFILTSIFFETTGLFRVAIPILISIIFLMGLSFSNESYSIFSLLKIPIEKRKMLFFVFLSIYILYSLLITFPHAPYFYRGNEVVCIFEKENCDTMITSLLYGRSIKQTVNFLSPMLNDNETFLFLEGAIPHIYARQNDSLIHLNFDNQAQQKIGRTTTIPEKIEYFKPDGRNVRYYVPVRWYETDSDIFKKEYVPNYMIRLDNRDVVKIYDIYNLTKI